MSKTLTTRVIFSLPRLIKSPTTMDQETLSSSTLEALLRHCLDGYLAVIKAFAADKWGKLESLAHDGLQLALWAELVGLRGGGVDDQLSRFRPFIRDELCLL